MDSLKYHIGHFHKRYLELIIPKCVCVCVREKATERESTGEKVHVCQRERERESDREHTFKKTIICNTLNWTELFGWFPLWTNVILLSITACG